MKKIGIRRLIRAQKKAELRKTAKSALIQERLKLNRTKFVELICGTPTGDSQLAKSLSHLTSTLSKLLAELPPPYGNAIKLSELSTPFLSRSILEVSFTALVARIDPFRVLTIGGAQTHATYDPGIPSGLAFRWQGDVLSDGKSDLWSAKLKPNEVSRALLGDYQERFVWKPAFQRFIDYLNTRSVTGDWSAELATVGIEGFVPRFRTTASGVFSRTSKGVHHEYVLPPATYFDESSLRDLLDDTLMTVISFATVANFCEHLCFKVDEPKAFDIFESLQP